MHIRKEGAMKMKDAVSEIYKHREDYIIIGLTGMTGSGASTVARVLTQRINDIGCSQYYRHNDLTNDQRSHNIIKKHAESKWQPFFQIKVRDIISSFVLDVNFSDFRQYIEQCFDIDVSGLEKHFNEAHSANKLIKKAEEKKWQEIDHSILRSHIEVELPKFSDSFKKVILEKKET